MAPRNDPIAVGAENGGGNRVRMPAQGEQGLGHGDAMLREDAVVSLHDLNLAYRCEHLEEGYVAASESRDAEAIADLDDGARRDDDD